MTRLLSLSNELLIAIFSSSTIEAAVFLSSTNTRLRVIWLEHSNQIVPRILRMPAYEDAVSLAGLEGTWAVNIQLAWSAHNPSAVPIHLCLSLLLHNADLASIATAAWTAWIASMEESNYRHSINFTSIHASYYLMPKLLLARRRPGSCLLPTLLENLRASSENTIITYAEFSSFLTGCDAGDEERLRNGISPPEEEWTEAEEFEVEFNGYATVEEWDYVADVLDTAAMHRYQNQEKLESVIFG